MTISRLRSRYHKQICSRIVYVENSTPNFADGDSLPSVRIAASIISQLGMPLSAQKVSGQTAGSLFEQVTKDFVRDAFSLLQHIRPGEWLFSVQAGTKRSARSAASKKSIAQYEQYEHLATLQSVLTQYPQLKAALGGDYLVTPDILVGRHPLSDDQINQAGPVVAADEPFPRLTPLRSANRVEPRLVLHASISCKWTIRSDRAQNVRTEGLNLIRNRKGHTPHIAAVTAEPLPSRIASLALGTGDLDCIYHVALPEMQKAVSEVGGLAEQEFLAAMIEGRRLRDISDLPLDLAI
jgi:hypothetical protein